LLEYHQDILGWIKVPARGHYLLTSSVEDRFLDMTDTLYGSFWMPYISWIMKSVWPPAEFLEQSFMRALLQVDADIFAGRRSPSASQPSTA
jgi:hypothetical protein